MAVSTVLRSRSELSCAIQQQANANRTSVSVEGKYQSHATTGDNLRECGYRVRGGFAISSWTPRNTGSPAFEALNIFDLVCARLEGWPRSPLRVLLHLFETLASQAPQDEVGILHRLFHAMTTGVRRVRIQRITSDSNFQTAAINSRRHCRARPGNPSSSKMVLRRLMDARVKPGHDECRPDRQAPNAISLAYPSRRFEIDVLLLRAQARLNISPLAFHPDYAATISTEFRRMNEETRVLRPRFPC